MLIGKWQAIRNIRRRLARTGVIATGQPPRSDFQPQGISGTGETTGANYQATGVTKESFKNSLQNGQANITSVNNFRIIGQGPGNNFLVHETMHVSINADGNVTVSHDNFSIDCK
jgi:hypothetical protein